jgi:hypothetical protein
MTRRRSATLLFNAIQLEGGLLPASLIEQIALQQAPHLRAADPPGGACWCDLSGAAGLTSDARGT